MSRHDRYEAALAALHEAALDDAHWPDAARLIEQACGSKGSGFAVGEGLDDHARVHFANFYLHGRRRPDLEHEYFSRYYPHDERLPRLRLLPDSRLVHVADLYSEAELKTSWVYHEGLPRMSSQNGLLARLDGRDNLRIVWGCADPVDPAGWGSDQLAAIRGLMPHLRHFVCVRQAIRQAEGLGASHVELLENTRLGVILLDRGGRIMEANGRARRLMQRSDALYDRDGFLRAWLPRDDTRLQGLVRDALPSFGSPTPGVSGSMTVGRFGSLPKLVLYLCPVNDRRPDFGARRVAALVLTLDPEAPPRVDPVLTAQALGLTPAENQVAVMLSEGRSVRDIARLTGRQANTVYKLLKQVYRKHGLGGQTDLIRLVLSLSELPGPRQ